MAKILFGARDFVVNQNLVKRLQKEMHEVHYVTEGQDMMAGLTLPTHPFKPFKYDLVIYDSGLLYDRAKPIQRARAFNERVVGYLEIAKAPVIVLAEEPTAQLIQESAKKAGFRQINEPFSIDDILKEVKDVLGEKNNRGKRK